MSWGVFRVYFWGVGLGCHEDPVCRVEDPLSGVHFEDVDGGMLWVCVEGVPRCNGYFHPGGGGNVGWPCGAGFDRCGRG